MAQPLHHQPSPVAARGREGEQEVDIKISHCRVLEQGDPMYTAGALLHQGVHVPHKAFQALLVLEQAMEQVEAALQVIVLLLQ